MQTFISEHGKRSEFTSQRSQVSSQQSPVSKNLSGYCIMEPNILPTSKHRLTHSRCCCSVIYPLSNAKSRLESVSLFSPSQSVSLLIKWASYLRFAHASRKFKQTDRELRRIWPVNAYRSSWGNALLNSKIIVASTYAFLYTIKSFAEWFRISATSVLLSVSFLFFMLKFRTTFWTNHWFYW